MNTVGKAPLFALSCSLESIEKQGNVPISWGNIAGRYWIQKDGTLIRKNLFRRAIHWIFCISQSKHFGKVVQSLTHSTETIDKVSVDHLERIVHIVLAIEKRMENKRKERLQIEKATTFLNKLCENKQKICQQKPILLCTSDTVKKEEIHANKSGPTEQTTHSSEKLSLDGTGMDEVFPKKRKRDPYTPFSQGNPSTVQKSARRPGNAVKRVLFPEEDVGSKSLHSGFGIGKAHIPVRNGDLENQNPNPKEESPNIRREAARIDYRDKANRSPMLPGAGNSFFFETIYV